MDFRQLQYFLAVDEERNFRRAAKRLSMAQAPLSRAIGRLERDLGVRLFDRSSLPITLTSAGEALAQEARTILDQVRRARLITERAGQESIPLRVGFLGAAADGILPLVVRRFRELHPSEGLRLLELESGLAEIARLRADEIDLALVRAAVLEPLFEFRVLFDEPFVAILPTEHPFASMQQPLPLASLVDEPFIFWPYDVAPAPFEGAIRAFADLGFRPRVTQEAIGVQAVLGLVSAGLGVSVLPASVNSLHREGVVTKPLADPRPTIPLIAIWRRDCACVALEAFLDVLAAACQGWSFTSD